MTPPTLTTDLGATTRPTATGTRRAKIPFQGCEIVDWSREWILARFHKDNSRDLDRFPDSLCYLLDSLTRSGDVERSGNPKVKAGIWSNRLIGDLRAAGCWGRGCVAKSGLESRLDGLFYLHIVIHIIKDELFKDREDPTGTADTTLEPSTLFKQLFRNFIKYISTTYRL